MLFTFGWKAILAVVLNSITVTFLMRREFERLGEPIVSRMTVPPTLVVIHLAFLLGLIVFAHHPVIFMGLLLFFIGVTTAYSHYQDPLILRQALLVAFFLAGLEVLGGQQAWWIEKVILKLNHEGAFYGAMMLTTITDNAAITYLASLVPGLSPEFKVALVSGAVTGGGLTLIANAPNPAGTSILKGYFNEGVVHPGKLFLAAAIPTLIAALAFRVV